MRAAAVKCDVCDGEIPAQARFCGSCGADVSTACPGCGHRNPPAYRFCSDCGTGLASEPAPAAAAGSDGERRHLTVMFCDLAQSTSISGRVDPEELRALLRAFQAACAGAIEELGGQVARFMGDGILAYFGYPLAHEDDADRAVRAGLAILDRVAELRAQRDLPGELDVRVGIHSGVVVVGEMGFGARRELADVVGEAPNIAARLQGEAAANSVLVSDATVRLTRSGLEFEPRGDLELRGVRRPVAVYRALRVTRPGRQRERAPFVGRAEELALLEERWARGTSAGLEAVLISGEPGVGKSRLIREFRARPNGVASTWVRLRCSELNSTSPYVPLIEHLERFLRFDELASADARADRLRRALDEAGLAPALAPALLDLLHLPGDPDDARPEPLARRREIHEALFRWLASEAERRPLVLVVEDLDWADPSTMDFVGGLIERPQEIRALLLATHRSDYQPAWPLLAHMTALPLRRLGEEQCRAMLRALTTPGTLEQATETEIVARSEGVPLYVEELGLSALEGDRLAQQGPAHVAVGSVPPALVDPLMSRLDRLGPAKRLVQDAAVLGRRFPLALLHEVAAADAGDAFDERLERAEAAGILDRAAGGRAETLQFRHPLVRDVAYESLLRSHRREMHARVAAVLDDRFAEMAARQPELRAHHLTEAGATRDAIEAWLQAGRRAHAEAAYQEATQHLRRGLDLVARLPAGPERDRLELRVVLSSLAPLVALGGVAQADAVPLYERAERLMQLVPDAPERPGLQRYLLLYHEAVGDHPTARTLAAEQVDALGPTAPPLARQFAHSQLAVELYALAEFEAAARHAAEALASYDPEQHNAVVKTAPIEPGMVAQRVAANVLLHQGELARGEAAWREALERSHDFRDPFSRAFVAGEAGLAFALLERVDEAERLGGEALKLAQQFGMQQSLDRAACVVGWAEARRGVPDGSARISAAVQRLEESRSTVDLSRFLGAQTEALLGLGELDEAEATLRHALEWAEAHGEAYFLPDLRRLHARLLAQRDRPAGEIRAALEQSLAAARAHGDRLALIQGLTLAAETWPAEEGARAELAAALELLETATDVPLVARALAALHSPTSR